MPEVSLRGLAREIGVNQRAVQVAMQNGRVRPTRSKKHGKVYWHYFDLESSLKAWYQNGDESKKTKLTKKERSELNKKNNGSKEISQEKKVGKRKTSKLKKLDDGSIINIENQLVSPDKTSPLMKSKIYKEIHRGKLLKLQYEKEKGRLVEIEKVKNFFFSAGRQVQKNILNIPDRISSDLASKEDPKEIFKILKRELEESLQSLSETDFEFNG